MSASRDMPPPYSLLHGVSNPGFQKESALLKDFLGTFPEVVR